MLIWMRFDYFVFAAVAALSTNALSIYNIIVDEPSLSASDVTIGDVEEWLSIATVPDYCTKDLPSPPTADQLKQCMRTTADIVDKSFFFTNAGQGTDFMAEAKTWRTAHKPDLMILDNFWLNVKVRTWAYNQAKRYGSQQRAKFWVPASQAMAELSSGTVRVILPSDADPVKKPTTKPIIWYDVECPALAKNTGVKAVYKVSPGSTTETEIPLSDLSKCSSSVQSLYTQEYY